MANVYAVKSGNWSDVTVWNTGALPTSADDIYANNFTVTVDISPTVLSIRNGSASGINAGGSFVPTNGITLTCTGVGVLAASVTCFGSNLTTGQTCTVNGNIIGGSAGAAYGANNNSTGTLNINGNCSAGGGQNARGVNNQSGGIVNITGNCNGGSFNGAGVFNNITGTVNITGNCTGGTDGLAAGAYNNGAGTINITGNCNGASSSVGYGAQNVGTGTINITGLCSGSNNSTGNGFINSSTGTITHIGTAQASATAAAIGQGAVGQVTILTGPLLSTDASYTGAASSGVNPCVALRWFPADTALSTFEYRMRGQTLSGSPSIRPARSLYLSSAYDALYPATANVRSGTTYGPGGINTGTLAVPPAGSVALGVPVDATTGTAALTAANIRAAVGLASANLDTQLAPLPNLDTTVSSRLAAAGYTAPPSAASIATAVWNAATSALSSLGSIGKLLVDNVNASISSRLASASYQAPLDAAGTRSAIGLATANLDTQLDALPTATENASAVRAELATELGRIDVATSTRSTFDPATDTVANVTLVATTTNLTNPPVVPTTSEIADAVRTELTPELDNLDAAVSTRSTFNPATDTVAQVALVDVTTDLTNPPVVPTPEQIAAEVRVELTPELDRIDADVSSRLSSANYTEPPTPQQNAQAVRTDLTPELDRIDVDVSSRLATADYEQAPTSEQNAAAVRVELTPELDRVANCATVATTGEQIQDAWARSPNTP